MPPKAKHDRELAEAALQKMQRGEPVSKREREALARIKAEQREKLLDELCADFPKKRYLKLAGIRQQTLADHVSIYDVPIDGPAVDLSKILTHYHGLLRDYGKALKYGGDALSNDPLQRMREEQCKILEYKRKEREGVLIHADVIRQVFDLIALMLRKAGEDLDRRYGPDVGNVLREALESCKVEAGKAFDRIDANGEAKAEDTGRSTRRRGKPARGRKAKAKQAPPKKR